MERKLTTMLAPAMVGYSRRVARDEARVLAVLRGCCKVQTSPEAVPIQDARQADGVMTIVSDEDAVLVPNRERWAMREVTPVRVRW